MSKPYDWLTADSRLFLKRDYLEKGVTPEQRVRQIADNAERILNEMYFDDAKNLASESPFDGFADKFENYMSRGFYSLSTPVWINFGNDRGLPVSCFGSYIDDSIESILEKMAEVGTMTKNGGGCSAFYGGLRERGALIKEGRNGSSGGPVSFMGLGDSVTNIISQGSARRGYLAAYLPIEHPDIEEFLRIRSEGNPIQDISIGVTITDEWMKSMLGGNKAKRKLWAALVQKRFETGFPYIMFTDNVNKYAPQVYLDKLLKIYASNMCAEICLHSSPQESFVCVLSSVNAEKWDEIFETDAIELLVYFLDAVNEEFIRKARNIRFMEAPVRFAERQRALGMGLLGWCSLLQSKMIPFESFDAKMLNTTVWRTMRHRADKATGFLAEMLGEPELLVGYKRRNVTTLAVAPTTSSGKILGTSPSIEVWNGNYFVEKTAKGSFTQKNKHLAVILEPLGLNTSEVWLSILNHGGSIQHLELDENIKAVFKTFGEVSQKEIVIQASQRQKYIDQGQSLNLMIHPQTPPKEVSQLLIFGWENGIKCFYYHRGTNPSQELYRNLLNCEACSA